jgi:hypothetical protein
MQYRDLRVDIHLLIQASRLCAPETRRAGAGEGGDHQVGMVSSRSHRRVFF